MNGLWKNGEGAKGVKNGMNFAPFVLCFMNAEFVCFPLWEIVRQDQEAFRDV